MSDTREYKDCDGKTISLLKLVKNEPEWAENQIRHRDRLERENAELKELIEQMREALRVIATHDLSDESTAGDSIDPYVFEDAYDDIVKIARAALEAAERGE